MEQSCQAQCRVISLTKEMEACITGRSHERKLEKEELGRLLNRFLDDLFLDN